MNTEDSFFDSLTDASVQSAARRLEDIRIGRNEDPFGVNSRPRDFESSTSESPGRGRSLMAVAVAVCGLVSVLLYIGSNSIQGGNGGGVPGRSYPVSLTKWDLVTDQDELHLHRIRPLLQDGPLGDIPGLSQLRNLFVGFSDQAVASWHVMNMAPISGQEEYRRLEELTADCCRILNIEESPRIFVKQGNDFNVYVTGLDAPHELVLTEDLWERYKDRPDELRFIIGHELGHIKCDHVQAHSIAKFLIHLIAGDGSSKVRSEILAPLLAMDLLHWCRESEQSADRAGLICVGRDTADPDFNLQQAEQALMRLVFPNSSRNDADKYLDYVDDWKRENRFGDVLTMVQGIGRTHPFVADRIKAIRGYSRSTEYSQLLHRGRLSGTPSRLIVESVQLSGLPSSDWDPLGLWSDWAKCDPILCLGCGETIAKKEKIGDSSNPVFSGLNWEFEFYPGTKLIVDIIDSDVSINNRVGSAVLRIDGSGESHGTLVLEGAPADSDGPPVAMKYHFR